MCQAIVIRDGARGIYLAETFIADVANLIGEPVPSVGTDDAPEHVDEWEQKAWEHGYFVQWEDGYTITKPCDEFDPRTTDHDWEVIEYHLERMVM